MILNLLHTLTLATTIGIGANKPGFNVEKEKQTQTNRANQDVGYTQTVTSQNWNVEKTRYSVYINNNIEYRDRIIGAAETYNKVSNPNDYLNTEINMWMAESVDDGTDQTYIALTDDQTQKITATYNTTIANNGLIYSPIIFQQINLNPANINRNVNISYQSNTVYEYPLIDNPTWYAGLKIFTFTSDTLYSYVNMTYKGLEELQETETYSGTKTYELVNLGKVYTQIGYNYTINVNLQYGKRTYIYKWIQPCYIIPTNEYNTYHQKAYIQNYKTIDMPIPVNYNDHTTTFNQTAVWTITGTNTLVDTYEVVDMGGLVFTILGMPFTFISTAFNITLFAGTPYSVNFSILFLSIFAVIVFVFIIKLILGAIGHK